MKKVILLASVCVGLYASNDYVPFSEFSKNQKLKYNFVKVENIIEEKKVIQKPIIRAYKKETQKMVIKQREIRKPILTDSVMTKTPKKVPQKIMGHEDNISFSAQLIYSPITSNYSNSTSSDSRTTNLVQPEITVKYNKHTVKADYFTNESEFTSNKIDTTWAKLGYRYNYEAVNIGIDANYVDIDNNSNNIEEIFPSLGIDVKNVTDSIDFNYGASAGTNNNIDYSYEYFFNVDIKSSVSDAASLVVGYKNKTIKLTEDEEKYEFKGPYIGINTHF